MKINPLDLQCGGTHYKQFKIQPIEFILANNLDFIQGNIIKYVCRYKFKDGVKDLEKIKHYVNLLLQDIEITEFEKIEKELN